MMKSGEHEEPPYENKEPDDNDARAHDTGRPTTMPQTSRKSSIPELKDREQRRKRKPTGEED